MKGKTSEGKAGIRKCQLLVVCLLASGLFLALGATASTTINASNDAFGYGTTNLTWPQSRLANGQTFSNNPASLVSIYTTSTGITGYIQYNRRGVEGFNLTTIPAGSIFSNATVKVRITSKYNSLGTFNFSMIDYTGSSSTSFSASDYQSTTFSHLAGDIPYSSITVPNYYNFTLNAAGLAALKSKAGGTFVCMLTHSADADNLSLTWASSVNSGYAISSVASGYAPQLTFDYTPPPVVSFTTNVTRGTTATFPDVLTVQFNDTSTGTDISAWNWSFSDGTFSAEQNPVHTFSRVQSYRVSLNVSTSVGTYNTTVVPDIYQIYDPLLASFSNTINGTTVSVNDTSTGLNTGSEWVNANLSAEFPKIYGAAAFNVNNNSIMLTSGRTSNTVVTNSTYYSADLSNWSFMSNGSYSPRYLFARSAFGGNQWIYGGCNITSYLNDVQYSNDNGASWSMATASPPWSPRCEQRFWVDGNETYIYGALNASGFASDVWNTSDGINWTYVTNLSSVFPTPAVVIKKVGNILVAYGYPEYNSGNYSINSYTSTDHGLTWTETLSNIGITDYNWPGLEHDGKVYSIAGGDVYGPTNETWVTPDGTNWYPKSWNASFPARSMTTPVSFQNKIVIIGGTNSKAHTTSTLLNDVWYSPNVRYNWSWGDGSANGTTYNSSHIYSSYGNYTICLEITSIQTNSTCTNVTISESIPVASFAANVTSGTAPLPVQFNDTSSNTPTSWLWVFGDGNTSTVQNATHVFNAGNWSVNLTATNAAGSNTSEITYINVTEPTPGASFAANTTSGVFPLSVQFNDTSTNSPTSWNWTFGDGVSSTIQNATHTYTTGGTFLVTLNATNLGGSSIATDNITVYNQTTSNFTANTTSGSIPLTVQFTDNSTNATSWNWTFGDGNTSTLQSPSHTYTFAGLFSVNHSASNPYWTNWTNKTNYINATSAVVPPMAAFTSNTSSGKTPLPVQFNDTSSHTPTSWLWTFPDDSSTSTLQNPTHTFTAVGNWSVSLKATNSAGDNTTSHYINVSALTGFTRQDLTMDPLYTLTLNFVDSATNLPIPVVQVVNAADSTSINTTVGQYVGTFNYSVVVLYFYSDGYTAKAGSYIMSQDRTETVQLVKSTGSQSQNTNVVYTQQQVRFIILNSNGNRVIGAEISANYVNSTLPYDSLTMLEQAFGISETVATAMLNGSIAMSGSTGSDGSLTFMMFPSLTYNLTITNVPESPWYTSVSPRETEYTIHQPSANATSSYSYSLNTNITIYEPNNSFIQFRAVYQDLSGMTTNVKYYVVNRTNNTIIYYKDLGNPGTSAITDYNVTLPNIKGVEYWAYFNKTTI